MTNKKYTNEDIISSLKIIATTRNCNECKIRNCEWGTCNCEQITANAALDLITCLQAENEKNENIIRLADKTIETANAEIERLKSANDEKFRQWDMLAEKTKQHYADLYNEAKDILKAEAYKEFAERLKGEIKREKESGDELLSEIYDRDVQMNAEGEKMAFDSVERIVDNLLKEMVGEEE